MNKAEKYRADIDGLRAISVIFVLIFHADIGYIAGGFVGVDIFFIISGYLICRQISFKINENAFSFKLFYKRRLLRIYPALVFVIFSSMLIGVYWLNPLQIMDLSKSAIASIGSFSNILFWSQAGYFEAASHEKILLHTWSLGVEEQFYILFPVMLVVLSGRLHRYRTSALIAVMLLSLLLGEYGSRHMPSANFYLLPTRMWEFLAGAVCTFIRWRPSARVACTMIALSLVVILGFGTLLDSSARFPSLLTVPLVIATGAILVAGHVPNAGTRLLATPPLAAIGVCSYSIYLWHQPLFAFARIRLIEPPSATTMALLCVGAVFLGGVTWRFIERPFRLPPPGRKASSHQRVALVAAASIATAALGAVGALTHGLANQSRIPATIMNDLQTWHLQSECFDRRRGDVDVSSDWFCRVNPQIGKRNVAIVGDSHVLSYLSPLADTLRTRQIGILASSISGCPPMWDTRVVRDDDIMLDCNARNSEAFRPEALKDVSAVILIARWSYYSTGDITSEFQKLAVSQNNVPLAAGQEVHFSQKLRETVALVRRQGLPVLVILQPPVQKIEPAKAYSATFLFGHDDAGGIRQLSLSFREHLTNSANLDALIRSAAMDSVVVETSPYLCGSVCLIGTSTQSYFYDRNHLSNFGAARIVPRLAEEIDKLLCPVGTSVRPMAPPAGKCPSSQ